MLTVETVKNANNTLVNQMEWRFNIVTIVLIVIALMNFLIIGYQININDLYDDLTTDVEQQKTLILYLADQSDQLVEARTEEEVNTARLELMVSLNQLVKTYGYVKSGKKGLFVSVKPSKKVDSLLYEPPHIIDARMETFIQEVSAFSESKDRDLHSTNLHYENISRFIKRQKLATELDGLIKEYQNEVEVKTENLKQLNNINFIVIVVMAMMAKIFIFHPLINLSRGSLDQISEELQKRQKSELQLKRNQRRLRQMMNSVPESVMVISHEGSIKYINPSSERLFEYSSEELEQLKLETLVSSITVDEKGEIDTSVFLNDILEEVPDEERVICNFTGITKSGDTFPGQLSIVKQSDQEDRYTAVLWDMTSEIAAAKQKEVFVATLTHDLKTPIKAEYRVFEEMKRGTFGDLPEGVMDVLDELIKSNRFVHNMVENLLANYRYQAGVVNIVKKDVNLNEMIQEIVASDLRLLASEKNHEIKLSLDKTIGKIPLDQVEMKRVIYNLLQNAISYTPPDTVITIGTKTTKTHGIITIEDNGQGISPENVASLFEPFQSQAKKYKQIGSGLGLYLCKQVVDYHGGEINVDSNVGKGTIFTINLPLTSAINTENEIASMA